MKSVDWPAGLELCWLSGAVWSGRGADLGAELVGAVRGQMTANTGAAG